MRGRTHVVRALLLTLIAVPASAQDFADHVIGLLEVPEIMGEIRCLPTLQQPVALYEAPDALVRVGELRAAPPQQSLEGRDWECEGGAEVRVFLGTGPSIELVALEHGYELESFVVTRTAPGWYRIRTGGRPALAWMRATPRSVYRPISSLFKDRLTYLGDHWDGRLYTSPHGGFRTVARNRPPGEREITVHVNEVAVIDGAYWARITFVPEDCLNGEMRAVGRGWVKVHRPTPDERPVLWFYSRGC